MSERTADERYATLLVWLSAQGRITVVDAARRLGVAQETIRRDLKTLESGGLLQRVHGGAVRAESAQSAVPVSRLPPAPGAAEQALAEWLWERLPREGTLLLGTGPLTLALTHVIVSAAVALPELLVVTNSLDVAVHIARVPQLSVYNVGGTVSRQTRAQEGDWALEELGRIRVDVSLVCPAGVSVAHGLSQATPAAAAVCQAEIACADRALALVPATALGRAAFVRFAGIEEVESILVAGDPPRAVLGEFADRGVAVRCFSGEPDVAAAVGER